MVSGSKLCAWGKVLSLCIDASEVIDVVLEAMFCLIRVWESCVESVVRWYSSYSYPAVWKVNGLSSSDMVGVVVGSEMKLSTLE